SSVHDVPDVFLASAGQATPAPSQFSARSHSPAVGRQTTNAPATLSAGQLVLVPSHSSGTSQTPAAGRHTAPAFPAGGGPVPAPSRGAAVPGLRPLVQLLRAGLRQSSVASLHPLLQTGPPAHGSPACVLQPPPLHVSAPLQNSPSLHGAVLFGCTQAPVPLHW